MVAYLLALDNDFSSHALEMDSAHVVDLIARVTGNGRVPLLAFRDRHAAVGGCVVATIDLDGRNRTGC